MTTFKIVGTVHSIIGITMLIISIVTLISSIHFQNNSINATGIVINNNESTKNNIDTKNNYPIVRFENNKGEIFERVLKFKSANEKYSAGDIVTVKYLPHEPQKARIADLFIDNWYVPLFFAGTGSIFTILGLLCAWFGFKYDFLKWRARKYNKIISTQVKRVFKNTKISADGRSPYQIESQWRDPKNNKLYIFKSKYFMSDPSEYLEKNINVKVDEKNYKKYWMNVSFLPKNFK